jgi:hypothetical protein
MVHVYPLMYVHATLDGREVIVIRQFAHKRAFMDRVQLPMYVHV